LYDLWRQDAYVWRLLRLRRLRQYIRLQLKSVNIKTRRISAAGFYIC